MKTKLLTICLLLFTSQVFAFHDYGLDLITCKPSGLSKVKAKINPYKFWRNTLSDMRWDLDPENISSHSGNLVKDTYYCGGLEFKPKKYAKCIRKYNNYLNSVERCYYHVNKRFRELRNNQ